MLPLPLLGGGGGGGGGVRKELPYCHIPRLLLERCSNVLSYAQRSLAKHCAAAQSLNSQGPSDCDPTANIRMLRFIMKDLRDCPWCNRWIQCEEEWSQAEESRLDLTLHI